MIFRIDEDRIVRTSRHTGFAANADRFIKVHDPVRTLEHGGSWTGHHARRMGALITAGHLVRPTDLGKDTNINVLDVGASNANGDDIFGLAGRGTRVTADAARLVDYLGPLHPIIRCGLLLNHGVEGRFRNRSAQYITMRL